MREREQEDWNDDDEEENNRTSFGDEEVLSLRTLNK